MPPTRALGKPVTATVVFADLTGSTAVFELLGNAKATQAVTRLTQWIGHVCEAHTGRVVKTLGDGVMAVFADRHQAVAAVVDIQSSHQKRILKWPNNLRMGIKVGVACGEIMLVDGDLFGDAVNLASRLSDLSGPHEIWASDTVPDDVLKASGVRFRNLGLIHIRGKAEPCAVCRIEWQPEASADLMTQPGSLQTTSGADSMLGPIALSWQEENASFPPASLPIHLGRANDAEFVVNDPRVSRLHARVWWRNGAFVLTDLSSYGTWVRFAGSETELVLRREECVLYGKGEIALGAPFNEHGVPTVAFNFEGVGVELSHHVDALWR